MAPLFSNDGDDKKDDGSPSALKLSGIVKSIRREPNLGVGV